MKNKINLKFYLIFSFLLLFMTACMDPVIDKDDSYSDFEAFDASDYLNDPNEGFINGGFEEDGLNLWGGSKFQFSEIVQTNVNLDIQQAYYIFDSILVRAPVEGENYLRIEDFQKSTFKGEIGKFKIEKNKVNHELQLYKIKKGKFIKVKKT